MDFKNITGFNFTWAIPGGAWLRDAKGEVQWCSYSQIEKHLGEQFWTESIKKQGWMTGCWVTL